MKLRECNIGDQFEGFLAVRDCAVRQASNSSSYLALKLSDGETQIAGRVWEHTGPAPAVNSVIYVTGAVGEYKGQAQLTVMEWRQAGAGEYSPGDFLPVCSVSRQELKDRLKRHIESVQDPGLSRLLYSLFKDDKEFVKAFLSAPAASFHHHACLGGLLWHTVGVADQCLRLVTPETDGDLLLAGAILHDIGKIYDYNWSGCTITMTDSGRLLGHIARGMMLVGERAKNCPELEPGRLNLLLHLIASHHGKLEWGSPVEPCTLEAIFLHSADVLDVQLYKLEQARSRAAEGESWTSRIPGLNREFWIGEKP